MNASHVERDVQGGVFIQSEDEPDLDKDDWEIQNMFKLKNFYDQMYISSVESLATT